MVFSQTLNNPQTNPTAVLFRCGPWSKQVSFNILQIFHFTTVNITRDIEIEFIGLRPGEKLFEEIRLDREEFSSTGHRKILRFDAAAEPLDKMRESLEQMRVGLAGAAPDKVRAMIQARVPEYQPSEGAASVAAD